MSRPVEEVGMERTDDCGLGRLLVVVVVGGLNCTEEVEEVVWGVSPDV